MINIQADHVARGVHTNGDPWTTYWVMLDNLPDVRYTLSGPYDEYSNPFGDRATCFRREYYVSVENDGITRIQEWESRGHFTVGDGDFGFPAGADLQTVLQKAANFAYARKEGYCVAFHSWWDDAPPRGRVATFTPDASPRGGVKV